MALSMSSRELTNATGVSEDDALAIRRATGLTVAEFADEQRPKLQRTLDKLLTKIEQEVESLKGPQAAIVYGILHDKHGTEAKTINQALHIHLKGTDAGSALKSILGPQANSIFPAPRPQDSKAPNYLEPVDVTATDATTTRTSDSKSPAPKP